MYGINGMNGIVYEQFDEYNPSKNGPSVTCILIAGLCVITVLTIYYICTGRGEYLVRCHSTNLSVHGDQQRTKGRLEEIINQTESMF